MQQAKEVMKNMIFEGVAPDFIMYTTLVTHTAKNCSTEEVIELHDYMMVKGVIPDSQTYNSVVSPLLTGSAEMY